MKLLLIEDDLVMGSLIKSGLENRNYVVDWETDGNGGWKALQINSGAYSCVILDLTLPGMDGMEVCRRFRENDKVTPVLILSATDETTTKITGLNLGADDYLTKPFDFNELMARLKALERRQFKHIESDIVVGDIRIDQNTNMAYRNDELLNLSPLEFRMLSLLMQNAGKVISREQIIERVWDYHGEDLTSNAIEVHMMNLRRKLKHTMQNPIIKTMRGFGYMFLIQE